MLVKFHASIFLTVERGTYSILLGKVGVRRLLGQGRLLGRIRYLFR